MPFLEIEKFKGKSKIIRKMMTALILLVVPFITAAFWLWFDSTKADITSAALGINQQITYQGKIANSSGVSVSTNNYGFQFQLYDEASAGTLLWEETWTATTTAGAVSIARGVFSINLGTSTSLSTVDFNSNSLFLSVKFDADGDGGFEETFSPRKRITSSPYAFNADTVDGLHATTTATAGQLLALDTNKGLSLNGVTTTDSFYGGGYASTTLGFFTQGNLWVGGNATSSHLAVTELCLGNDCETAWPSSSSGSSGAWYAFDATALSPTSTRGILVNAASSTITNLVVNTATTSNWLNIGTYDVIANLGATMGAGDLYVGRNATTSGNLTVSGTTNLASASTTGTFYAGGYASSTLGLFTQGNGHYGSNLTIDGNATTSGYLVLGAVNPNINLAAGSLWASFATTSQATSTFGYFADHLKVATTTKADGKKLIVGGTSYFSNTMSVVTDSSVTNSSLIIRSVTTSGTNRLPLRVHAVDGVEEGNPTLIGSEVALFQRNWSNAFGASIAIVGGSAGNSQVFLGDKDDIDIGRLLYRHATNSLELITNNTTNLTISSNGLDIAANATTSGWLNVGTTNVVGLLGSNIGAGDLYVGRNATTSGNLTVLGWASTTLGLFTQGNLWVGGNATTSHLAVTELCLNNDCETAWPTGGSSLQNWVGTSWGVDLTPTSTSAGIFVKASSTIENNFRVQGNTTTTGNFTVGTSTLVIQHDSSAADNAFIGIGTANPTQMLHLSAFSDAVIRFETKDDLTSDGPNNPAAATSSALIGTAAWSDETNVFTSNNSRASVALQGIASWKYSHYLTATSTGFSLPSTAVVKGIQVEVEKSDSSGVDCYDNAVKIIKDGVIGSTDRSDSNLWPATASEAYTTYGGPNDLWGEDWTYDDINATDFGLAFSAKCFNIRIAYIDHIRFTVYYSEGVDWAVGSDVSQSSAFKISGSSQLGSNDYITVSATGNVGISTSTPSFLLQAGSIGAGTYFSVDSSGNATTSGRLVVGTTAAWGAPTSTLTVIGSGMFTKGLIVGDNATTSGYMIVGTTNPTFNLSAGDMLMGGDLYVQGNDINMGPSVAVKIDTTISKGFSGVGSGSSGGLGGDVSIGDGGVAGTGIGDNDGGAGGTITLASGSDSDASQAGETGGIGGTITMVSGGQSFSGYANDGTVNIGNSAGQKNASFYVYGNATTSGYLVIGTTNPAGFNASAGDLYLGGNATTSGRLTTVQTYNETTADAANVYIDSTGKLFRSTSSKRYKYNINYNGIDGSLLYKLKPASYTDHAGQEFIGFVAEDVAEVEPRLVLFDQQGQPDALHYGNFAALLTKAIQDQQLEIADLQAKINSTASSTPSQTFIQVVDNYTSDVETLAVRQVANFYGTIMVVGEAGFISKVTFASDIEVKGKIYASKDQAGGVVIPAFATSTEVIFENEYWSVPRLVATAQDNLESKNFWISDKTAKGFRLNMSPMMNKDIKFDWIALAVKGENEAEGLLPQVAGESVTVGCTDSLAINYNPLATADDGSCQYPLAEPMVVSSTLEIIISGCTDPTASNYNLSATADDGSCQYPLAELIVVPSTLEIIEPRPEIIPVIDSVPDSEPVVAPMTEPVSEPVPVVEEPVAI